MPIRPLSACLVGLALSACAGADSASFRGQTDEARVEAGPLPDGAPAASPRPLPAPVGRTAEALDTTTEEERVAALATAAPAAERELGRIVASLGSPAEQGIWVKTPLVSEPVRGRAVWRATGKEIAVELRPAGDDSGASQISLAALRLLGAPLTELPELTLYGP